MRQGGETFRARAKIIVMRRLILLLAVSALAMFAQRPSDQFSTSEETLTITPIHHASMMIAAGGQVIHVDPWSEGNYDGLPKADIILITDIHPDHLDLEQIAALQKPTTVIVAPSAVAEQISGASVVDVLGNGESTTVGQWAIEAIPMYNLPDGNGAVFHEKGRGNGYIVTYGGLRIYIAGDTQATPEMRALEDIDVAFIPMNLPYTMTPEEAADGVKDFAPGIVYPYHYQGSDLEAFQKALEGTDVEVRIRDWYY